MSDVLKVRLKVDKRRYSQLKKRFLDGASAESTKNRLNLSSFLQNGDFFRQMFDRNRAIQMIVDPTNAQIIRANQAACDFYGYSAEQLETMHVTDVTVLPEKELAADLERTVSHKGTTFEARHRLASGEIRDVEIFSGSMEFNYKPYIHAIIQDITERKEAEKALRESRTLYELFTQNMSSTSVVMFDTDMRYTKVEGLFAKRYETATEKMVGKKPQDLYSKEASDFLISIYQRALQGESFSIEHITGSFAYEAYLTPLLDENGVVIGGMILNHDISERIGAEKALRESEELYRLFTQHMPNTSVMMFDTDMRFTLAEGGFLKKAGLFSENLIGKTPHEVFAGDTLNFMLPMYRRALAGESFAYDRVTPDYAYQSYANPLKNADGQIIGGMFLTYDITEAKRSEEALRASEARFHSLVDLAPVGIIQTDLVGKRIFCNSHWCEMTGITLEEALSDENFDTIYPDDLQIASASWEAMMETNLPFDNAIFRYQRPDKSTVWVSGNGRALYDVNGDVTGYLGTVTDITHHKLLEDTLVMSESRFRTLIDFAPVGIIETDAYGTNILTNTQWSVLSGLSDEEPFTVDSSATIHPDDLARVQAINQESLSNASPVNNIEYRFVHMDERVVWVSASSRPLFDELGRFSGQIITMTDITERRRLEDALRHSEEQLRVVTGNIQDLIIYSDSNGKIIFVSPSSQSMLGYNAEELLAKHSSIVVHPTDFEAMTKSVGTAFQTGNRNFTLESRLRHADGHYISVETVGTLLVDAQSNYTGGVFISRDVSERKRLQNLQLEKEKLQGALDKELELSTLKTRMMERIAHEFRTPLTVIQASTETLTHYLDRLSPEQRANKTVTIMSEIQRLTDMLDEIGLVINGSFMPDRVRRMSIDVSLMCRELAAELETQLDSPGRYVLDLPDTALASLDPQVSQNAIMQIMRNAASFSPPSSIIHVSLSSNGNGTTIRVSDNGMGILPHEQSRIFEPFFRGSNIGEIGGMGVGLTIARAAIEAHGGTITVKSVPEQGTAVMVWFPT